MYEPSEEIKEQIAAESWSLELGDVADNFKKASKATQGYYMKQANDWSTLSTIKTALELLETKPQWQDKPDKEGWWWARCLVVNGFVYFCIKVIRYQDNTFGDFGPDKRHSNFPPSDHIYYERDAEWLYIPEPGPYKEETRNV